MSHYQQYETKDLAIIFDFVASYPFANICKNNQNSRIPSVISVPVILHGENLEFHVAKKNPAYENFEQEGSIAAIFNGPNAAVSPSWYKHRFSHQDRSKTAPTWNYAQARVEGVIEKMNPQDLRGHLSRLVAKAEGNLPNKWDIAEIDDKIYSAWSAQIEGFKFYPRSATAIFKFSQEQSSEDVINVIEGLKQRSKGFDLNLAQLMQSHSND